MEIFIVIIIVVSFVLAVGFFWKSKRRGGLQSASREEMIRGFVSLVNGNLADGIHYLKESARLDTGNVDAYLILGEVLSKRGNYSEASRVFNNILVRSDLENEYRSRTVIAAARNAMLAGEYDKASKLAEKAMPDDEAFEIYIETAEKLGDWEKAVKAVEKWIEKSGDSEEKRRLRGYYNMEMGTRFMDSNDHPNAQQHFDLAAQSLEDNPLPLMLKGDSLRKEGKTEIAVDVWQNLADRFPQHAYIIFNRLERALFDLGDFPRMMEFYRHLNQRDENTPFAASALARIYYKMGDWDKAKSLLAHCPPSDVDALILKIEIAAKTDPALIPDYLDKCRKHIPTSNHFVCSECGSESDSPLYRCPKCNSWNSYLRSNIAGDNH
jgi:lipopolysaccharide biosynthesis regulator YciM